MPSRSCKIRLPSNAHLAIGVPFYLSERTFLLLLLPHMLIHLCLCSSTQLTPTKALGSSPFTSSAEMPTLSRSLFQHHKLFLCSACHSCTFIFVSLLLTDFIRWPCYFTFLAPNPMPGIQVPPNDHTIHVSIAKTSLNIKAPLWILKDMSFHIRNVVGHPCDECKKCHCQAKDIGNSFYQICHQYTEIGIMWK